MNETYTFEDRAYLNPNKEVEEQDAFINNLRGVRNTEATRIASDTHNLGTDVPSIKGGLTGSEGVWDQQYIAPQTNELVSKLRSAAQASALNTALSNLQEQYKNQYNQKYRKYNNTPKNTPDGNDGDVTYDPTDPTPDDIANSIDTTKVGTSKDASIKNFMNNWEKYDKNTPWFIKFRDRVVSGGPGHLDYHDTPREYLKHVGGFKENEIKSYEDRYGINIK